MENREEIRLEKEKQNITYSRVPLGSYPTMDEIVEELTNLPNPEIADFFKQRYSTLEMQARINECREIGL